MSPVGGGGMSSSDSDPDPTTLSIKIEGGIQPSRTRIFLERTSTLSYPAGPTQSSYSLTILLCLLKIAFLVDRFCCFKFRCVQNDATYTLTFTPLWYCKQSVKYFKHSGEFTLIKCILSVWQRLPEPLAASSIWPAVWPELLLGDRPLPPCRSYTKISLIQGRGSVFIIFISYYKMRIQIRS